MVVSDDGDHLLSVPSSNADRTVVRMLDARTGDLVLSRTPAPRWLRKDEVLSRNHRNRLAYLSAACGPRALATDRLTTGQAGPWLRAAPGSRPSRWLRKDEVLSRNHRSRPVYLLSADWPWVQG
jgi:Asp-tRNA(Asn)/Glu-tRNA(Gln) amidotransferase C subunit